MNVIEIKNLSVYYEKTLAIDNISLNIKSGQFLGIIGENGGGKTTLLKVLLGLMKPSSGSVVIKSDGNIGYVPQFTSFDKFFPIRVLDVILMGKLSKKIKLFHRFNTEDVEQAKKVMERLDILELIDRKIGDLSGGQIQKVLIARALINNPKVLLLDEPTASIDPNTKVEIYSILKELNRDMTILLVSHDTEDIISYVDSIACLNKTLHFHKIEKNEKKLLKEKYSCPVQVYLNEECDRHCSHCGGEIND